MQDTPQYFVDALKAGEISDKLIRSLRMTLASQPLHWLVQFQDLNGQLYLLETLEELERKNP